MIRGGLNEIIFFVPKMGEVINILLAKEVEMNQM